MIEKNNRRREKAMKLEPKRRELHEKSKDMKLSAQEREAARQQLQSLPRNSSMIRVRNRCGVTGRARAYYRDFGLSRIMLRECALKGLIPGMVKASW
jgi:small subunit ribosomal protein S14